MNLILFTALTFNTSCYLLYIAVLAGLRLPLTTVNGGGLVCVLGLGCQIFWLKSFLS